MLAMQHDLAEFARHPNIVPVTMHYPDTAALVADRKKVLAKGPVALLLFEDDAEAESTIAHHLKLGFRSIFIFCAKDMALPPELAPNVHRVDQDLLVDGAFATVVNTVIDAAPGLWFYFGYNAEYLYYPYCEHRTVGELIGFCTEERRDAVLSYVIDLYAADLEAHPSAVSLETAHLDRSGYYALARTDENYNPLERQLDFNGGLRWRFEEHVPYKRRRIDRISLFKAKAGLELRPDHTFNEPEYNTYACPWHHSLTAAICSFRTAKALRRNPGSRFEIESFYWHNSVPFTWNSQQLLDLGLMEPGQWF